MGLSRRKFVQSVIANNSNFVHHPIQRQQPVMPTSAFGLISELKAYSTRVRENNLVTKNAIKSSECKQKEPLC